MDLIFSSTWCLNSPVIIVQCKYLNGIYYISVALPEDDSRENHANIYLRKELVLQNLVNRQRVQCFPRWKMNSVLNLKTKRKSESCFQIFAKGTLSNLSVLTF